MTERKELIARLREEATLLRDSGFPVTPHLMKQAADMLEADISRQVEVSESTRRIRKSALGTSTCRTQLRAEMIARLRNYNGLSDHDCVCEAAFMLEADATAVPQEPVRNDMSIQLLERLIKTLTNLGYATPEGGIEAFNADLPTQLYHLCFGVDRVLSALKTVVPQEPVAWQHRGRPAVNREWGDWHTVGYKPKGPECTRFMMRPLFAEPQPQRPRLTDAEILTLWAQTYVERGTSGIEFARAIEKKVRGEA